MPNFLSDADVEVIRGLVRSEMDRRLNAEVQFRQKDLYSAPEVYVARAPSGGIPALDDGSTGTGTGALNDDVLGYAECRVYKIEGFGGTADFVPVDGLVRTVYNPTTTAIDGNAWVTIVRDKFGQWLVAGAGGGGGSSDSFIVDHVHVVGSGDTGTGSGTHFPEQWYCERVTLPSPGGWPPVADSSHTYSGIVESENRYPRIIDTAGGDVTHIIPLYQDNNGNYYIVFWKTDTEVEFEYPSAFTITEVDCVITATPSLTTKRISLVVTDPSDRTTGLTLEIEDV